MPAAILATTLLSLLGVAAGLVLVAAALGLNHLASRVGRGIRVPGVVVGAAERPAPSASGGSVFHPVVRYWTADGELVTAPATLCTMLAPPRDGRAVTVVYDPARPDTVGIASTLWTVRLTSAGFMTAGLTVAAASTAALLADGS